jgi:Ribbon-helix-helix protein, copG family
MEKTTVYLPADLKAGIKRLAKLRNVSEAEVIRDSIRTAVKAERPKPTPGILRDAEPISHRVDELLKGFGEL